MRNNGPHIISILSTQELQHNMLVEILLKAIITCKLSATMEEVKDISD